MYTFYFEKLEVWKDSRKFIKDIYKISEKFPSREKFGMISQLRTAAVSIASNIAEGSSRSTKKDQANFTTISYSSLMETLNLIILSLDFGYLEQMDYDHLRNQVEKIANKLNGLRNSQLGSK
jgi:four helix bundle protein